jgi:hypothetical protein
VPHQEAEIGFTTTEVVAELLLGNGLFLLRAAHGVLGLAGKHGLQRREWAYAWASKSASEVTRLQGILNARTEVGAAVVDVDGGAACGVLAPAVRQRRGPAYSEQRDPDYLRGAHHGHPPGTSDGSAMTTGGHEQRQPAITRRYERVAPPMSLTKADELMRALRVTTEFPANSRRG